MISYEVMHFMKRKTKGKKGWMALKRMGIFERDASKGWFQ